VPAAEFDTQRPELERIGLLDSTRGEERRAGAVREQHPEVGVASLRDATETTLEA
jgi:hypothetical protein